MLKLQLQHSGHLMWRTDSLGKTLMLDKIGGRRRRGWQRMRWHHWLDGHEFEQAPGIGDGQRRLVCCSPWGPESDTIEWLNWTGVFWILRAIIPSLIPSLIHYLFSNYVLKVYKISNVLPTVGNDTGCNAFIFILKECIIYWESVKCTTNSCHDTCSKDVYIEASKHQQVRGGFGIWFWLSVEWWEGNGGIKIFFLRKWKLINDLMNEYK